MISIIGSGYVGLITGVGFALRGHKVICMDIDKTKVSKINSGVPPIYEEGLEDCMKRVINNNFEATNDMSHAISNSSITFIAIGTPSNSDGSINLKYIESAADNLGKELKKKGYHLVVVKSTVLPETTEKTVIPILEKSSGKKAGRDFGVCMNPEFLREGKAMDDFMNPDRIVIGELDKKAGDMLEGLYKDFNSTIIRTNLKTAEMIKYTSNAFLAMKVSFSNEIGNMCKKLGIDVYDVMDGIGHDKRIGRRFLNAGCGFGGSCFPKDVKALISKAKDIGYEPKLLEETLLLNERQKIKMVEHLKKKMSIKDKKIAILGLAFKPDTDDTRESPAIDIISRLKELGAIISVYDPRANVKSIFPDIEHANSINQALNNAHACLIITDWDEFKQLEDKDFDIMKNKVIIEGRKVLDYSRVKDFEGVAW
jgi:UDPglucose 6-dehydrogenase